MTNLAGEAFEALDKKKWSRRDCMEYRTSWNGRESLLQDKWRTRAIGDVIKDEESGL
jgi:hypothetical protein